MRSPELLRGVLPVWSRRRSHENIEKYCVATCIRARRRVLTAAAGDRQKNSDHSDFGYLWGGNVQSLLRVLSWD